jgi:hypothetical protein
MSDTVSLSDLLPPASSEPPEPPAPINIDDLLNDIAVVQQKEAADKAILDGVSEISPDALRQMLVVWATQGFPSAWTLMTVSIQPPTQCSDGVARGLEAYIQFVSGKTLAEHVAALQARMSGIVASFAWTGQSILIVVSRA